ncbi:uncharacterized protein LOC119092603 [Pollicipes pollicipes]|uniref:uncharacterized protein LOC119092603 n=1 Tax=Pollicipes pollicipes TaxID=41117 RepID=UPI001884D67B|nr:uncharacterized protein LOC119092603 [Pollicipes pollicipes]
MLLRTFVISLLLLQCTGLFQELDSTDYLTALSDGEPMPAGSIDDLIRKLLEQLRANMSQGFPQWGVPPLDPLHIANIPIAIDESGISVHANITDGDVTDLSQFVIDKVHVSLLTLKAQLALSLSDIKLVCNYFLEGLIADLFPLYGSGPSSVALSNISLSVNADLNLNRTDGHEHVQIATMDFDFHVNAMDIQIHDLFDNDDLATVIDGFADDIGPLLIDILVNDTRRDLLPAIIEQLNDLLWNVTLPILAEPEPQPESRALVPALTSTANANSFFDRLIPYLQNYIKSNKLDPFPLPEFDVTAAGTGVKLYQGSLTGLSSCGRNGDSQLAYDEAEWLSVSSGIGFQQMSAGYTLKIEVFGIGPHVTAEITLSNTKAQFAAQISSKSLAIKLTDLKISDIGGVSVKIRGLGIWEFLLEPIVDVIVDLFKGQIADAVSGALFSTLDDVLSKIDLLSILENL